MKAEEWLTYFMKIYGRRPKMTEVDEAIQNGSLLANRAEVEGSSINRCGFLCDASWWWGNFCLAFSQLTNPKATIPHGGLI